MKASDPRSNSNNGAAGSAAATALPPGVPSAAAPSLTPSGGGGIAKANQTQNQQTNGNNRGKSNNNNNNSMQSRGGGGHQRSHQNHRRGGHNNNNHRPRGGPGGHHGHGGHDRNRGPGHYGPNQGNNGMGMGGRGPPPPPPPSGGRNQNQNMMNNRNQGGALPFGGGGGGPMMRNAGRGMGGPGRGQRPFHGDGRNNNMKGPGNGGFPMNNSPRGQRGPMDRNMRGAPPGNGNNFNQGPLDHSRRGGMGPGRGMGGNAPPPPPNQQNMMGNIGGPPPPPPPPHGQQMMPPPPPPGSGLNNNMRQNMPMMNNMQQMPNNMQQQGPGMGHPTRRDGPGQMPPPPPMQQQQRQTQITPGQQIQPQHQQHLPHGQVLPPGQGQPSFPQQQQNFVPQMQNMPPPTQQQFPPPMQAQQVQQGSQFQQQQIPPMQSPNIPIGGTPGHQGIQGQQQPPQHMVTAQPSGQTNPQSMAINQMQQANIASQKIGMSMQNVQTARQPQAQQFYSQTVVNDDKAKEAANWTAHKAPNGTDYYYNSVTKVSTYEKPACLNRTTEGSNAPSGTPATDGPKQKWKKYKDQASGKIYYSDGATTTWDKPIDFDDSLVDISASSKRTFSSSLVTEESTPTKKKKKKKDSKSADSPSIYNNKAEAVAAFKGLLLAKDVSPTLKWNDVVKLCSADSRWEACNTMGERKQALAEFQTKRANELRELKRKEKVRAKEAFMSLLTDILPNVRAFNASANTRFSEVRDSLSKDDRFYAVDEEDTREELFYDFVEEVRKREERQRRGRKRDAKDAFIAFLKYREEGGGLTFASTWSSFLGSLDEKDKVDSRFVVTASMNDSDRQLYFADYVIELQAAEDEKRRRIRDARRRAEKAQRDAYRECLRKLASEGKILPSSRWRNFEDMISAESAFGPVSEQSKDAPRDIFEDFVDDWAEMYRRDKALLSHLTSTMKNFTFKPETEYETFSKALLEAAAYSADAYSDARRIINNEEPLSSVKLYFDEALLKSKKDNQNSKSFVRRSGTNNGDSSSDEGEIIEDENVDDGEGEGDEKAKGDEKEG